jgi:8-oxo-dGTP pyrophosphatase MutT (NUDIX family)
MSHLPQTYDGAQYAVAAGCPEIAPVAAILGNMPHPRHVPVQQVFTGYDAAEAPPSVPAFCAACGTGLDWEPEVTYGRCPACRRRTFRNPYPGVSVLVVHEGRVLLGRRREGAFLGGRWCLPCGYVEHHEDFLAAARREVREETGVNVRITAILTVTSNFLSPDLHSMVITLLAEPVEPNSPLLPGDDIDRVEWFDPASPLPPMAFEGDSHIIERYFAAPFAGSPVQEG